jgi:uncharacterized RDD family membrane protein YckC
MSEREMLQRARPATFDERLTAFLVDALLFYGLALLLMKLAQPQVPVLVNPDGLKYLYATMGLLALYHAGLSAMGRPTAGKALLGLRVVGEDLRPLSPPWALARSAGYLLSGVFNLGFLWALFHPEGRAWHDLLAGSRVLAVRPRPRPLGLALGGASLLFLAGTFLWQNLGAPRFYRVQTLVSARTTMKSVGVLNEVHRHVYGRYTENLDRLLTLTPDPEGFRGALVSGLSPDHGILIRVDDDGQGYSILANARDLRRTRLEIRGPVQAL